MSKYTVSDEGVSALKNLSTRLPEQVEAVKSAADALESSFESNHTGLGPHSDSIRRVIEEIREATNQAASPVVELAEKVGDVAEAYQAIIDNNRY